ncbi:MAG: NAD(P)-dependent oxidoreductase [Caldisericia bacterium]
MFSIDNLHDLLPKSNAVIVSIPFSPETTDLIGEKELKLMPKNSIIVNVSRGPVVNEKALYDALKNNEIYGAGSDVWYVYPKSNKTDIRNTLPSKYPFHELENVVMSPHRGGRVHEMEPIE